MNRRWKIYYKGYVITHDSYGCLACYLMDGDSLEWCYFGASVDVIKFEIDRRVLIK